MEDFSDRTVARRDRLDLIRTQLKATRVPRDAFGYIPGVGGKVHDAYEEFVAGCGTATEMASETVLSLAQAVHQAAQALLQTDQFNAEDISTGGQRPGAS
ncbi:MAG TPA: hypothetical protein VN408_11665 [Actinoplanes sp.]|nr:hypothetical protein [Actinoplanes sp.]